MPLHAPGRLAVLLLAAVVRTAGAQGAGAGVIAGTVVGDAGDPVAGARVAVRGPADSVPLEVVADARGAFRTASVPAGRYGITVRHLGFRPAELAAVRVVAGDTVRVRVILTTAPTQLSTVVVVRTATALDALAPESPIRVERGTALLLPTARDASALVALVPGAKDGNLWGGAGAVTNDYRVDGVPMNHPGAGGDFLQLPRDWIDALEVRGVGANAEFGNFQGGVVNAITRSGSNTRAGSVRTYLESEALTATNFDLDEQGVEQAGRREVSGEVSGPLRRDRLFYFLGGQLLDRSFRSPDLASAAPRDFQRAREERRDVRGLGKLSWLRAPGERAELLLGYTGTSTTNAGLNGLDDPAALQRVVAPTVWYDASWHRARHARATFEARVAGYGAHETRDGNGGALAPAVRVLALGDLPLYQNAEFRQRSAPSSHSATVVLRDARSALGVEHTFAAGIELTIGAWKDTRTRSGGLTWRPYRSGTTGFSPIDAGTWGIAGSDWGGERRVSGRTGSAAVFVQDELTIGQRVTLSPGLRVSRWTGALAPCDTAQDAPRCGLRTRVVTATGLDPRLGVAWDVTGRNTFAIKAHWGRYHQGMYTLFFDRASGANAYTNERFYYTAPPITDARQRFTAAQRDAMTGSAGFSPYYDESILDEAGAVAGYRQPYVDQAMLAVQKALGTHWRLELLGVARHNGDIVGLVDRNLATNYTALTDIKVDHRLAFGTVLDAHGEPLVLPTLYVSNRDLIDAIAVLNANLLPGQPLRRFAGYGPADTVGLTFAPDVVLTSIPAARRRYRQLTGTLSAAYDGWRAEGSLTAVQLVGNVAGVTGHGVAGTAFTAGPFVRPNEAINSSGPLPDATEFEAKLWVTARLPFALAGGLVVTHILGERVTPSFTIEGRYTFTDTAFTRAPAELVRRVIGQTILVEPRGSRHYASRSLLDLHVERAFDAPRGARTTVSLDVFNALGSNALVRVKTSIDDQATSDPASRLGAPRERVAPRSLRLGVRIG